MLGIVNLSPNLTVSRQVLSPGALVSVYSRKESMAINVELNRQERELARLRAHRQKAALDSTDPTYLINVP